MGQLELRSVAANEALEFGRVAALAFGNVATDEEAEETATHIYDPDWAIGVYDRGRLVATTSAVTMELTLPAGSGVPFPAVEASGVTGVTVLPTHRRQGLLNRMMAYQLGQFRDQGVRVAVLIASESVIYGRYGYGLASSCQEVAIATRRAAFQAMPPEQGTGRLHLLKQSEAADVLPVVHEKARRLRPGELSRSKTRWEQMLRDPERRRDGGGPRTYVVHENARGITDGYASYRYRWKWEAGLASHNVTVEDIYSTSPETEAALWRFLLDLDLVEQVTARHRPLDDPLRWRLADPRQLRTIGVYDFLWAHLVDIPAALASRGYGAETELVLEVTGPSIERYSLTTSPGAGLCRPAKRGEKTDLTLGLADLGALYLGGCRPSVLAAAGRAEEARRGALARADVAFASPLAPFCGTSF